tara:strand:- start:23765 stop:24274 length:510 start_codon:yes stop_codon:yes gene_type:complete
MKTLNVRNARQVALFHCELQGQISDGMWENTAGTGWKQWCETTAVVNPDQVGVNFFPKKDNFNLNSKQLLEVVGNRMCVYARLADDGFTLAQIELIDSAFLDLDGAFRGLPTYEGAYWDKVRLDAAGMLATHPNLLNTVQYATTDDGGYGMKELRADLKDLKVIFKTQA